MSHHTPAREIQSERSRPHRRQRLAAIVTLLALLVASINIAQFLPIESTRDPDMDAVNVVDDRDQALIDLALNESANIRRWFSSHAAVGERAPGAIIELPAGAVFSTPQIASSLYAYGKASQVRIVDVSPPIGELETLLTQEGLRILRDEAPPTYLSGTGKIRFQEWILLTSDSDEEPRRLLAYESVDSDVVTMVLIDDRLVNGKELARRD